MIKLLTAAFISLLTTSPFAAPAPVTTTKVIEVDKQRTVFIAGAIDGNVLAAANAIEQLSTKSTKPIYIVLNSPGGNVIAGIQVLSAISAARTRGATIKCVVPMMAASMAFIILAACDERYAFPNSLLLWHPVRTSGSMSSKEAEQVAEDIARLERPLVQALIKSLNIDEETFYKHYYHETLWTGASLAEVAPSFLTLVQDIRGAGILFSIDGR